MLYKLANNLINIPPDPFLMPVLSSTHNYHHHHYKLPYSRVNAHLFSLFPTVHPHLLKTVSKENIIGASLFAYSYFIFV